jgi:hypothetical protein
MEMDLWERGFGTGRPSWLMMVLKFVYFRFGHDIDILPLSMLFVSGM